MEGMGCNKDYHSQARMSGADRDAIEIEHEPLYIDRRGEEDITAAGLVIMALICFLLFFVTLITGGL